MRARFKLHWQRGQHKSVSVDWLSQQPIFMLVCMAGVGAACMVIWFGCHGVSISTCLINCRLQFIFFLDLGILSPPQQPETIPVSGQNISFNCTVCGHRLYWYLNGVRSRDLSGPPFYAHRMYTEYSPRVAMVLTVKASAATNNTLVYCAVRDSSGLNERSASVRILVQGTKLIRV